MLLFNKHSLQINPLFSLNKKATTHPKRPQTLKQQQTTPRRPADLPPRCYQRRVRAEQNMPLHFFYAALGTSPLALSSPGHWPFIWRNVPLSPQNAHRDPANERPSPSIHQWKKNINFVRVCAALFSFFAGGGSNTWRHLLRLCYSRLGSDFMTWEKGRGAESL